MFSGASWLIHRIHYDLPFTTEHDGHPGLLVHGPLQGTYMVQAVQQALGSRARLSVDHLPAPRPRIPGRLARLRRYDHRDRRSSKVTTEVWIRKADGTVTTTGTAVFEVTT